LAILDDEAQGHFDPDVYAAFRKALPSIREIQKDYADSLTGGEKSPEPAPAGELVSC